MVRKNRRPLPEAASRGDTGQLVYATFLEETDVFEQEPIKGVDLSVLHNNTVFGICVLV